MTVERRPNHDRSISYKSYERSDGLFDIEGTLRDTKHYACHDRERGILEPGAPVHDLFAILTLDADMVVQDFRYEMNATPFRYCLTAVDPRALIGLSVARSWRKSLAAAFGPRGGCTHLRELVLGMGTIAFQTLSPLREHRMFEAGVKDIERKEPPFYLGGCHSWDWEGPVVEHYFPQFHRKKEEESADGGGESQASG